MHDLSLSGNPFAVLRVSPRARVAEIEDAFEDAVVDRPANEPDLLRVKQLLLTPNARLIAELSWLSEVAPRRAEQLIALLDRADIGGLLAAIADLPPLTAANLAAEAVGRFGDQRFLNLLIDAHGGVSPQTTLGWLNSTRATAGFARVEAAQLDDALRSLRTAHARFAVSGIVATGHPAQALAALLTPNIDPHDLMLKEICREYDHWSTPHLGELERDINIALAELMATNAGAVDRVNSLLAAWDELSQPAQLYSQLSGLDEERSLRIYRVVRSRCVDLANDRQRFDDAHAVATVMRDLFKELPTAARELGADVDTLARLSMEQRLQQTLEPLGTALAAAQANVRHMIGELKSTGFSELAGGLVGPIYRAFVQTSYVLSASEHVDAPMRMIRSFALDLNNDHDDPSAAVALLRGLSQARTPADPELKAQLDTDIRITENNRDHRLLTQALKRKDRGGAIRLLDGMLARTPPGEDAAGLRTLHTSLKQQQTKQYWKWGGWAAAGAFVLYLIVQGNGSAPTPPTTYTPDAGQASDLAPSAPATDPATANPAPAAPAEDSAAAAPTSSPTDVSAPPVGTSLELDASQVRYCVFEKARLTALKDMVTGSNQTAVDGFNARIVDYNSRCGSYRYHAADLDAANVVVAEDGSRFNSEARAIADGWTQ